MFFYDRQSGQAFLSDHKLEAEGTRLRSNGPRSREVEVPAYAATQNSPAMSARIVEALMRGVSTSNYREVTPETAEIAGVSRSAVGRAAIEASEAEVKALLSRRFDELQLLVI
jgi:hypothetical protein